MNGYATNSGIALTDAMERNRQEERRRGLRALLARPLLAAEDPAYLLVRRHAEHLRQWFGRETGWALQIEADHARLLKRVADTGDSSRPARPDSRSGTPPFSRRRYCLLCLALAVLERGENQTALGRLGNLIVKTAADPALEDAGLRFGLENREERRDLVAVVRLLLNLGVLKRVAGDEDAFVSQAGDALYDVNRRVLASLLVTSRGPSTVEMTSEQADNLDARIRAITETFVPDTPEARNQALRRRLTRRLLDDPVVYWNELAPEELNYLNSQRAAIARRIEEATGLVAEIRAEGMAMVDAGGDLTDFRMPAEGTEGHATLLLAEYLAASARAAEGKTVSLTALHAKMREWIDAHKKYWRKSAREAGGEIELCQQAIDCLVALRLAERTEDGVRPLPALGRFALDAPKVPEGDELSITP